MAFRKPLTKSFFRTDVRSSRPEVFCKKDVFRNFTKFKGKHLCQSLFFNKVTALRHATLLKKRLWHRCLTVNFVKFLRTSFFIEHLWWLLLLLKDDGEKNTIYPANNYLFNVDNRNTRKAGSKACKTPLNFLAVKLLWHIQILWKN